MSQENPRIKLSLLERGILLHALKPPDALAAEEEGEELERFEQRCEAIADAVHKGEVVVTDPLDTEVLMRAAEENTFFASIEGGAALEIARAVKAVDSLQSKLSIALGREVIIPCR